MKEEKVDAMVDWLTGDGSEASHNELGHVLCVVSAAVHVLHGLHDKEADGLVGALLHDGGCHALVHSADT